MDRASVRHGAAARTQYGRGGSLPAQHNYFLSQGSSLMCSGIPVKILFRIAAVSPQDALPSNEHVDTAPASGMLDNAGKPAL